MLAVVLASGDLAAQSGTVAVAVVGSSPGPEADQLRRAVRGAVSRMPKLQLVGEDTEKRWFLSSGPEEPGSALRTAEKWIRRAQKAFREFRLDDAKKAVRRADAAIEPWRGHPDARDIDRAHLVLAVSIAHAQRDESGLEEALSAYARRFGHEGAPPESGWPPDLQARLSELTRFGQEVLNVLSQPPAIVFLDGRRVGVTPLTLGDLEPGPHRVVARADGFFPADVPVHVEGGKPTTLELELAPRLSEQLPSVPARGPPPVELREVLSKVAPELGELLLVSRAAGRVVLRRLILKPPTVSDPREVIVDGTESGPLDEAMRALYAELEVVADPSRPLRVPTWAWVSGGLGVAAVGVGTVLRLSAASQQSELATNLGGLTQVEAYQARDQAADKASAGTIFIGAGSALIVSTAAYVLFDWLSGGEN